MALTLIGAIVLILIAVVVIGMQSFNTRIEKERIILFTSDKTANEKITENDLDALPDLIKNYLIKTKVLGKSKYCNLIFTQKGQIKTHPKKGWLSFTATQYMSSNTSGFIWKAQALPMLIRDKYINQKGEVKVSLLGLKNVVLFSGPKVDQSSLGRYFGELIWFPIGFLDPDIAWEDVNDKTVKGTIIKGDLSLTGYFYFDKNGMIDSFRTKRYRNTTLEDFVGKVGAYQNYDGLLVPNKMTAIWDLKDGKLEYFKADIIEYKLENSMP